MKSPIKYIKNLSFPWQTQDPFLFCVYHKDNYPEGDENMAPKADLSGRSLGNDFQGKDGWSMYHGRTIPGFPSHPHKGFETITIVQDGIIDHSDSLGAAGRFGNGDVQWMTAGKGVQHSEMFPMLNQDKGNSTDFFQIWINLPQKSKLVEPHFAMLWSHEIPELTLENKYEKKVNLRIIAGDYKDTKAPNPTPNSWANDPRNEVIIWTLKMDQGSEFILPAPTGTVNRSLYLFKGSEIYIEGTLLSTNQVAELTDNHDIRIVNSGKDARLLFLQGKPINEPVAQYGPFVMNSQKELMEAFEEYQRTEFGGWPWPSPDHVHGREKGKFALYPDGTIVEPEIQD